MSYQTIIVRHEQRVALITLNRPEVMNALNEQMRQELMEVLRTLRADQETRAVVITGAGKAFCAGADLNLFREVYEEFRRTGRKPPFASEDFVHSFVNFPKPMIAAINGVAVGWGRTMPLTCDIRIASDRARFSAAFVRVGVTPEFGSSFLLQRLIGYGRAAELVFTARMISAEEALAMGLVNSIVPSERLLEEAVSMARSVASMPPGAVTAAKALLRKGMDLALPQLIDHEAVVFRERMTDEEHYQAVLTLLQEMKSGQRDQG